jgi:alanine racemase
VAFIYTACMLSWIDIDRQRLRSNIEAFRNLIAPGTAMMVVVKANAYGHGLEVVARVAADHADWLGVNNVDEAMAITVTGIGNPIAILGHTLLDRVDDVVRNGYRQVLYRLDVAEALSRSAEKLHMAAKTHLKIETGTNRQGIALSDLEMFLERVRKLPGLEIEGAYTHFANIEDTLDPSFAQAQVRRFQEALATIEGAGFRLTHVHGSATAGAVLFAEMGFTMVRLGIGAYGIWPSRETQVAARERRRTIQLQPVLNWKTRVVQVKNILAGEYVGYGLTYQARRPMRVAVVPIGYYDGYDRKLSNSGRALVRGQFAPVVGRIAMNMTMLDVTDTTVEVDDEVVLLGRQGDAEIRVEELSEKIGTIPYEVVARINPLIPRIPM